MLVFWFKILDIKINWIEVLACLGSKYGGESKRYKESDTDEIVKLSQEDNEKFLHLASCDYQYSLCCSFSLCWQVIL